LEYGKSLPHFDSFDIVCEKDWATGANAENSADAASTMEREGHQTIPEDETEINLNGDETIYTRTSFHL
jgi:hypothetical protein